jgi:hypothetical protein
VKSDADGELRRRLDDFRAIRREIAASSEGAREDVDEKVIEVLELLAGNYTVEEFTYKRQLEMCDRLIEWCERALIGEPVSIGEYELVVQDLERLMERAEAVVRACQVVEGEGSISKFRFKVDGNWHEPLIDCGCDAVRTRPFGSSFGSIGRGGPTLPSCWLMPSRTSKGRDLTRRRLMAVPVGVFGATLPETARA